MKKHLLAILLITSPIALSAQNTLSLNDQKSPPAKLSDVAWIQGNWEGEAFGGQIQEVWLPPLGDSMVCAFKLVKDGKVQFYELVQIREENESLVLRLKHFHGNLKGWEEKDDTVDFPLVKMEKDAVYFDGFTIKKISKDQINMYVVIGAEADKSEVEFNYYRSDLK